ncbi:MAG TPA: hypothetical protein VKE88_03200, partial [Candidatus Nanoarchaeia archaeon]|nr:hypothetical protein [Candidatus Nanoarchaeia archaeon]
MGVLEDAFMGSMMGTGFVALAGVAALIAAIFIVAVYVYTALVIKTIAQKGNAKPLWLAWVPVANLVLLLKSVKIQWQWIFALLLTVIPRVGSVLLALGTIYVWYKVCKLMHKPEWISVLMIIPF